MGTLFDQISNDIRTAMKDHDKVRVETLRNVKKYFIEAKTATAKQDILEDSDALRILTKLVKQGEESANTYLKNNRKDLAEEELAQVAVIKEYLPKQMTEEEIEAKVKSIIEKVDAQDKRDMGKIMSYATEEMAGKAEGKVIAKIVKKFLE